MRKDTSFFTLAIKLHYDRTELQNISEIKIAIKMKVKSRKVSNKHYTHFQRFGILKWLINSTYLFQQ